jgi:endonuclease-8
MAVETRGKAMLIRFANDRVIYSHNQLYGRWYVKPAGQLPRTNRSLRLAIHNRDHSALLYSASEIEVLRTGALDAHPFLRKLGPDVLDPALSAEHLRARLAEPGFARRGLPALLLDQSFVAGLGNYLRSEILFAARLHPDRRLGDCSPAERGRLARAIQAMARRAYRTGGITNDPARAAALKKQGARRAELRHHVFAREGRPCWACQAPVVCVARAGRKLFFCPGCQPEADAAA